MRPLWYRSSNLSHFLPKIKGRGPHLLLKDRIWAEILSGVDEVVKVVSDALIFFSRTKLLRKASKLHAISSSKYPILDSFFYLFPFFLVFQFITRKVVTYFINVKMADDIIKAGIQIIEKVNHLKKNSPKDYHIVSRKQCWVKVLTRYFQNQNLKMSNLEFDLYLFCSFKSFQKLEFLK